MHKISAYLFSIVLGALVAAGSSLWAQDTTPGFGSIAEDSDEPIEITADQLMLDDETGLATFKGNVEIIQGNLLLKADFVEVFYTEDRSKIDRMFAKTNVRLTSGPDKATSDAADYDLSRGSIILTGNVSVLQEGNTLLAERVEFDVETGASQASGRVKTVLTPASE